MAQAEYQDTLSVPKDRLFEVITHYEDYPQFVEGCTRVEVERKGPGKARVTYHVSMMKEVTYTLDHEEDRDSGEVRWTLVESDFFSRNTGRWKLEAAGDGETDALYELDVEFKIKVPGFILKKLVKGNLPSMVKGFEKRAKSQ